MPLSKESKQIPCTYRLYSPDATIWSLVMFGLLLRLILWPQLKRATVDPWSDGIEGVLRIPQNSSITGTSPSDCSVSYPGHSLGESYSSVEMHSVYSTAPAD